MPTEALGQFALAAASLPAKLRHFAEANQLAELVYLGTCNRIELLYVFQDSSSAVDLRGNAFELLTGRKPVPGEAERTMKCWSGEGAAEHLFLVASGLDSACLGENEIVAQLRQAFERSAELDLLGVQLRSIGELALQISAKVRSQTQIGHGRISLAEIAVDRLIEGDRVLANDLTSLPIALVGVSPMIERVAQSLCERHVPLLMVNRSVPKGRQFAEKYAASFMSLDAFVATPPAVAAVVTAVGAAVPVIASNCLKKIQSQLGDHRALSVVDFGVPANVDPIVCRELLVERIGMDELAAHADKNRHDRNARAAAARVLIDSALDELRESTSEKLYSPLLGALQNRYQLTAREGLLRLFKKELSGLSEQERVEIERWCYAIARRFAHIPSIGLRGLIRKGPPGSLDAFIEALDAPFAEELRLALDRAEQRSESRK